MAAPTIVRPRSKLERAVLLVKWKVAHVHLTGTTEYRRRYPRDGPGRIDCNQLTVGLLLLRSPETNNGIYPETKPN